MKNDLRSRGTRITLGLGWLIAIEVNEKESTAKNVAKVGVRCIVREGNKASRPRNRNDIRGGLISFQP